MFILWLYQNLFWPNLVWHLTCHIIVKILESCLITVCVLWSWFLFAIVLCVYARARVCEGERVWVFFVCLFYMPCVEWIWMFLVLLFYVIYSRTIASIANVFCWLYPTLNKVYLILSFHSLTHCSQDTENVLPLFQYSVLYWSYFCVLDVRHQLFNKIASPSHASRNLINDFISSSWGIWIFAIKGVL